MADGSSRRLVYSVEDTPGVPPTPNAATELRVLPGGGMQNERTAITSGEIRSDRAVISSKLGNNAISLGVPIELSYASHDDFMASALGSSWVGGFTETVNITSTTGGVFSRTAGSWLDDGFTVGTYVTIEGQTVLADDGAYEVTAVTALDLTIQDIPASGPVTITATTPATAVIFTAGAYGVQLTASVTDTITVAVNSITLAGTLTWNYNIEVGDRLYFQDFVNAGNNGWHEVTGKTDTVLTFANDTLIAETINTAVTVTYATASGILTVGNDLATLFVEEQFTDIPSYVYTTGAKIDTWNLSMQPEAIVTGDFALQGVTYSSYTGTTTADSVANSNINTPFDSYTGYMDIGGVAACVISGLDFSLANNLSRDYALLVQDACRIGEGRSITTGTISGYFIDTTIVDLYDDETIFSAKIMLQDIDSNSYMFGFPRAKLNSHSLDIPENSITFSAGVDFLGGDTLGRTNFYMHRTPFIV